MDILAVDIGSNTIKCLLARKSADVAGGVVNLFEKSLRERISAKDGLVKDAAEVVIKSVNDLRARASAYSQNFKTVCLGTSALRGAKNKEEICSLFKERTGLNLDIISGDEEARLSFIGAMSDPALPPFKRAVYMDLGGGSLEIALAQDCGGVKTYRDKKSFPLGAVRLTNLFGLAENGGKIENSKLEELARHCSKSFENFGADFKAELLIGAGGAITAARYMKNGNPETEAFVSAADLRQLLAELKTLSIEERCKRFNLSPNRADIIPAAFVCTLEVISRFGADGVFHTFRSLRHGAVLSM